MSARKTSYRAGQVAGLTVFLFGIALLAFTYFIGYTLLTDLGRLSGYAKLISPPELGAVGGLSVLLAPLLNLASYIIPVIILFVLGYIASKIAYHGIQMWRSQPGVEGEG